MAFQTSSSGSGSQSGYEYLSGQHQQVGDQATGVLMRLLKNYDPNSGQFTTPTIGDFPMPDMDFSRANLAALLSQFPQPEEIPLVPTTADQGYMPPVSPEFLAQQQSRIEGQVPAMAMSNLLGLQRGTGVRGIGAASPGLARQAGEMQRFATALGERERGELERFGIDANRQDLLNRLAMNSQRYGMRQQGQTARNALAAQLYGGELGAAASRFGTQAQMRGQDIGAATSLANIVAGNERFRAGLLDPSRLADSIYQFTQPRQKSSSYSYSKTYSPSGTNLAGQWV